MKIPQFVYLLCAFSAPTIFAGQAPSEIPGWLHSGGNANPGSIEIFTAFHSVGDSTEIRRSVPAPMLNAPAVFPLDFRTIDGTSNNPNNPLLGSAGTLHNRLTTVAYGDGTGTPAGADRKSPREISNLVSAQTGTFIENSQRVSGFLWQWGQFVDHDMSLTRVANPAERFDIPVPKGDPQFDPRGLGDKAMPFQRSSFGIVNLIRQQINANSAFIDGSVVYGCGNQISQDLRTLDGTGHLKTSDNNLLPFNVNGLPNQPDPSATFFLAGDVRANENSGLTALQTLFMREHNSWADTLRNGDPRLNERDIFFRARAIVGAEIQLITYRDFIPLLLGPNALSPYVGYNPDVDPSVSAEFGTAAMRVGHSFLPPVFKRLNQRNRSVGDIAMGQTFFNPKTIISGGIDPWLRGLAKQVPQQVDPYIDDAVRCFLIAGRAQGFDLAALNIQRGRDHGLAGYNRVRTDLGLAPKATFADVAPGDDLLQAKLLAAYTSPDNMDFWVGGLSEPHLPGAQVGESFFTILKDQFERERDGDRFWYETYLDPVTLATVQAQTLSIIIKRNCPGITTELQDDVFQVPPGF